MLIVIDQDERDAQQRGDCKRRGDGDSDGGKSSPADDGSSMCVCVYFLIHRCFYDLLLRSNCLIIFAVIRLSDRISTICYFSGV